MPSLEQLLAAIEAIYDSGMDEARWPRALDSLADLLGGTGTVVAFQDQKEPEQLFRNSGFKATSLPAICFAISVSWT